MNNPFEYPDYFGKIKPKNKTNPREGEWEETFGDTGSFRPQTVASLFDYKKIKWAYVIAIAIFAILFLRLFYLQVFSGNELRAAAEENRYRTQILRAGRGIIYDRNNNILTKNTPSFDVLISPIDLPKNLEERKSEFENLKNLLDIPQEDIDKAQKNLDLKSYQLMVLKDNLDRNRALEFMIKSAEFPGIKIEANPSRNYLFPNDFSHVLGYIGKLTEEELDEKEKQNEDYLFNDWIGKDGLEKEYEKQLKGEHGKEQVEVDSYGNVMKMVARKESISGYGLGTSLDRDLQIQVRKALESRAGSGRGAAVVMNPNTGEILSLVSIPSFDTNKFVTGFKEGEENIFQDEKKPLIDRVIAGQYPPGSTVKPIVASGALEEGVIDQNTTIEDKGFIDVPNQYNPDIVYRFWGWNHAGLGKMNLFSAIAKSSDIYFYNVGGGYGDFEGLGDDRLQKYYKIFGLNNKTGIDLPGELDGFIPNAKWKKETKNEDWYQGDTYNISIGQGDILATPLQVASFTSTVANGGTVYRPLLVAKIIDQNKNIVDEKKPQKIRENFIKREYIDLVKQAMRQTVEDGSAKMLGNLPIAVAGKTGTSEHGESKIPHAWFTAFAPYPDPEIVVTILIEEGEGGDKTAVPAAYDIIKWWEDNKFKVKN